jgi:hypothetical protein
MMGPGWGNSIPAFFGAIKPAGGDGTAEHAVFDYASYGRQPGMLSTVVAIAGLNRIGH